MNQTLASEHRMRQEAELAWQGERAQMLVIGPTPGRALERYRAHRHWRLFPWEFTFKCLGNVAGKSILDFGCGEGEMAALLAKLGARVTGVDISPQLVAAAERRATLDGVADRTRFIVADVTESGLPQDAFDMVVCMRVLHHIVNVVDLGRVLPLLVTALKPGGVAVIVEPVAPPPVLRRIRDMLPFARNVSPTERELNRDELALTIGAFAESQVTFFRFLGRLARFFPHDEAIERAHSFERMCAVLLFGLDRLLLTLFPFLWRLCGTVAIVGRKPEVTTPHSVRGTVR